MSPMPRNAFRRDFRHPRAWVPIVASEAELAGEVCPDCHEPLEGGVESIRYRDEHGEPMLVHERCLRNERIMSKAKRNWCLVED